MHEAARALLKVGYLVSVCRLSRPGEDGNIFYLSSDLCHRNLRKGSYLQFYLYIFTTTAHDRESKYNIKNIGGVQRCTLCRYHGGGKIVKVVIACVATRSLST